METLENQNKQNEGYEVFKVTEGPSKSGTGQILIETQSKGLIYRVVAYLNGHIIDAREVSCIDLNEMDVQKEIFRERMMATHGEFCNRFIQEKLYAEVLSTSGTYKIGEGLATVVTSIAGPTVRTQVFRNGVEFENNEVDVDEKLVEDEELYKTKYSSIHADYVEKFIKKPGFPVNTFLNPIIKRLPFYKSSPMTSFFILVFIVLFLAWIISQIFCGKALPKIVKSISKPAGFVVKDFQKMSCGKEVAAEIEAEERAGMLESIGGQYGILPKAIHFTSGDRIQSVHVTNFSNSATIARVASKTLENVNTPAVTPDMLVSNMGTVEKMIGPNDSAEFRFKIEETMALSKEVGPGLYKGTINFTVIDKQTLDNPPADVSGKPATGTPLSVPMTFELDFDGDLK